DAMEPGAEPAEAPAPPGVAPRTSRISRPAPTAGCDRFAGAPGNQFHLCQPTPRQAPAGIFYWFVGSGNSLSMLRQRMPLFLPSPRWEECPKGLSLTLSLSLTLPPSLCQGERERERERRKRPSPPTTLPSGARGARGHWPPERQ